MKDVEEPDPIISIEIHKANCSCNIQPKKSQEFYLVIMKWSQEILFPFSSSSSRINDKSEKPKSPKKTMITQKKTLKFENYN